MFCNDITKQGPPDSVISEQNITKGILYQHISRDVLGATFTHPTLNLQNHSSGFRIYRVSVFHFESEKCWRALESTKSLGKMRHTNKLNF